MAYFANGLIILQPALKFTGYAPSFGLCNLYYKDALLRDDRKLFQKLNLYVFNRDTPFDEKF